MALESAALAVGKTVGERAGRAWLTARNARNDRNSDLADLVASSFRDNIARRRLDRQFQEIADTVAERILKLSKHEYGELQENDKEAALAEVVAVLTGADLSDDALFDVDVDAVRLSAQIRAKLPKRGSAKELGEAGSHFYETVLSECCDCFVRIIISLPQFSGRASAELLSRLSELSEEVRIALNRLPIRSLFAPDGTAGDSEFRLRYLEHVTTTLDKLDLFGVRLERYRARTSLSVAYISLNVFAEVDHTGMIIPSRADGDLHQLYRDWQVSNAQASTSAIRVEFALGSAPYLLVRGEAGSGKSTLLRWIAVTSARSSFSGKLKDWNGRTPFLVKLRSHAGQSLPKPEQFLQGVADTIVGIMPVGWVHRQLNGGRAILLVDGIDELPTAQRRSVRPWLSELVSQYPGLKVVVTSRPAAAESTWLTAEGFSSVFLERMNSSDIRTLIHQWHDAVKDSVDLPCQPDELPRFESALLARMESAPHLQILAGSPLLAAMLCALNLDRVTNLPRDRMGIYAAVLEMLLERRDAERSIPSHQEVLLEREQKIQILQDLAWRLSVTSRTELPRNAVLSRVSEKLLAMPRTPGTAEAVLDHLLQRSGLIREPVPGRIDFIHRTVQEYLAAKQCTDDGDVEPLITGGHRAQWWETTVMAAGHANAPLRDSLLSGLLDRIDREPRQANRLRLLVACCMETIREVPIKLRARIESCLRDLIPPRDGAAARKMSAAGEIVLDRLPDSLHSLTSAMARASVQATWQINGPDAFEKLKLYSTDRRKSVRSELLNAWPYFDPKAYAEQVLSNVSLHDILVTIDHANMIPWLGRLRGLKQVEFRTKVMSLDVLRSLQPGLVDVSISHLAGGDLLPLQFHRKSLRRLMINAAANLLNLDELTALEELRVLSVGSLDISDVDFLRRMPQLNELHFIRLDELADYSPLASQRSLRALTLGEAVHLSDISLLPRLSSILTISISKSELEGGLEYICTEAPDARQVHLAHSSWLSDLSPLRNLSLRAFTAWGCAHVDDVSALADQADLEILDLEGTSVCDLEPLRRMHKLRILWIKDCSSVVSLQPLKYLESLSLLYMQGIPGEIDLTPLASNSQLKIHVSEEQQLRGRELFGGRLVVSSAHAPLFS